MLLLLTTLLCAPAAPRPSAEIAFSDILDAPPQTLDLVENTLWEMLDELELRREVVDMVVVGSFAYGIARPRADVDPSDLDVIVYMKTLAPPPMKYMDGLERFNRAALRYNQILSARLGGELAIDIKPDTRELRHHVADPDWNGYSLLSRRMYNRADGKPRQVRGYFYEDVFYLFDRAAHQAFARDIELRPRPTLLVKEGDQIVFYDRAAWDRGERLELLRSFRKAARKGP